MSGNSIGLYDDDKNVRIFTFVACGSLLVVFVVVVLACFVGLLFIILTKNLLINSILTTAPVSSFHFARL
jgi:hypothetical protein